MEDNLSWSEYKKLFLELMEDNGVDFLDEEHSDRVMKKVKSGWKKNTDYEEVFDKVF